MGVFGGSLRGRKPWEGTWVSGSSLREAWAWLGGVYGGGRGRFLFPKVFKFVESSLELPILRGFAEYTSWNIKRKHINASAVWL